MTPEPVADDRAGYVCDCQPTPDGRCAAKANPEDCGARPVADDRARVEWLCEVMHDAYETAAIGAGWETQARSRKPWTDVPDANKVTMRAAVRALLAALSDTAALDHDPTTSPEDQA